MPEGTVDVIPVDLVVAAIIAVAARRPRARRRRSPRSPAAASTRCKYRLLVDNVRDWFTEHPLYDAEGQPIVVPEFRSPAAAGSQGQLKRAKTVITSGRERAAGAAAARQAGDVAAKLEERKRRGRAGARVRRAVRPLHRVRGDLPGRQPARDVGRARRRPTRPTFNFDPRVGRLADVHHRRSTCRRSSQHARVKTTPGKTRTDRSRPPARAGARPGPPRRRVRPREHADRQQRRRELLVAGHPPPRTRRERMRYVLRTLRRGAAAARRSTARTAATSCATSTAATRTPRSTQIDEDAGELLTQLILTKSFPAGMRRVREHRALGHRTVLITGALDFAVEGLRPLFDEIVAAEMTVRPGRHATAARCARCRRPARPGPRSSPTTARPRGCGSRSASPTPTRPATCRCSRPSASPSPSTRRPASPPSPASAAGWSSTGRRPAAAPARCCPLGPHARASASATPLRSRTGGSGR